MVYNTYAYKGWNMNKNDDQERYNIKGADRCFQILDLAISLKHPLSLNDVIMHLDVNVNMAFRLLSTIVNSGYMDKNEETGTYSISLKALQLSRIALSSLKIRRLTMPYLELIGERYRKANLNLGVYYEGDILVIDRIDSQTLPRTYFTPGKQLPFNCSGLGKVLTSELSEPEIDVLISRNGLKKCTNKSITDPEKFKEELQRVREEGVGRDRNELIDNDNCSAVPLRDHTGKIVAAISLSALETNMSVQEVEDAIPVLKETARKISFMLGYNASDL